MELRIGDRLIDKSGEWEVIGPLYRSPGGKNAAARLRKVGRPDLGRINFDTRPTGERRTGAPPFLGGPALALGIDDDQQALADQSPHQQPLHDASA